MKTIITRKKITIATNGPLKVKGGIRGPIEIPYMEEISTIGKMLMCGYKVYEHLSSGKIIKLNTQNYNKENGSGDMVISVSNVKPSKPTISQKKQEPKKNYVPIIDNYEIRR